MPGTSLDNAAARSLHLLDDGQSRKWTIVVERQHNVSECFTNMGHRVQRHDHKSINTGATNAITNHIKTDQIEVVFSEFPIEEYHVTREKMHAHCTQLMTWARLCQATGTPFILIGTFGKKWHNQVIDQAAEDGILHVSYHRLCSMNLELTPGSIPSAVCYVAATTFPMSNHPCTCSTKEEDHAKEQVDKPYKAEVRNNIFQKVCEKLISKHINGHDSSHDRSLPDSAPTYPTEERERQKIKQKAMKEAGLEPRKKKFKVEDHHDDCGNDLSGLGTEIIQYAADYVIDTKFDVVNEEIAENTYAETSYLALWFLRGCEASVEDHDIRRSNVRVTTCIE